MSEGQRPRTTRQWHIREEFSQQVRTVAHALGISASDLLDVTLAASLASTESERTASAELIDRLLNLHDSGQRVPPLLDIDVDAEVLVTRLGPTVADDSMSAGYRRAHIGAALSDGPLRLWEATRGYWRIRQPLPRYLVATRLGVVLAAWRVNEWIQIENGKWYSPSGDFLDVAKRRTISMPTDPDPRPELLVDDVAGALQRGWQRGLVKGHLDVGDLEVATALAPGTLIGYPGGTVKSRYRLGRTAVAARLSVDRYRNEQPDSGG